MRCAACGHENPVGQKFCGECGARLEAICTACGTINPPINKFCGECGASLSSSPSPQPSPQRGEGVDQAGGFAPSPSAPAVSPSPRAGEGDRGRGPASFANGRYEVKKFLGEGGKKKVYLAHDNLLDRDVAFALIKTEGLDEVGKERIRREAQAMGRLGAHPHIVSVFDLGEHEDQPYIVTELMGGGDVEGVIEKAPENRAPLEQSLKIADEVCQGLEYAHAHQIVHRDLKPGNVWLTADGRAKLGDFGLAVATDRPRLTQAGLMVGTVNYMPPEQALGGEVTPRSDLYSLGAMLYELVTGRPPFVGDESVAIITQHLNTPPISPSWHNPTVPAELETLILRLLEKDPSRRPASAEEVRKILATINRSPQPSPQMGEGVTDGAAASSLPLPAGERGPSPLYRRVFVGREPEIRQGQTAFDRALSGQGGILMVAGEPGIGKTALCEQFATYAAMRGGKTLVGHSYEEGSLSLPYLPFIEAMRSYVLERDPEALREELGSGAEEVARIVSAVRERLGTDLSARHSALSTQHSSDPEEERWRLLQAVGSFLRNASTVQPLLIVLEDLHWSDRGTLDLLTHLARQLEGARILIVGTYRDLDVDRSHPLSSTLAELRRGSSFERILLRGLAADEVHRMLAGIANQEVTWRFSEAVHRQTEGNPLFVQEVVRYLAEEGLVTREDGHWRQASATPLEMHIPEGLREVIGKRLARLSPECNRLLTLASVIGRDFSLETLQTIAGLGEDALLEALEEAVRVGVLQEEARVGSVQYRFAHAFFRQTLYEEMSVPRRLRIHQQVARSLEEQYEERLEDHATELADHFAHSSDPKDLAKAVEYCEIAAQRANSVNAYGEAVRLLDQALEIQTVLDADDRARRCDLLLALGQALLPAGDAHRAFETVAPEAFQLAEALGNRGRAARACRVALEGINRFGGYAMLRSPAFRQWAERADHYAEPDTRVRVYADVAMSTVYFLDGQWREAREVGQHALALARRLGDAESVFTAAAPRPQLVGAPPYQTEMRQLADELMSLPKEGVSSRTLELALRRCQAVFLVTGQRDRAEACWVQLDTLASRTQDATLLAWPATRDAIRCTLDGELEAALEAANRVQTLAQELGVTGSGILTDLLRYWPGVWLGREAGLDAPDPLRRAALLAYQGKLDEARTELRAALERSGAATRDDVPTQILADLLEIATLVGEKEATALLAARLHGVVAADAAYLLHNVARYRGAAAALLGDRYSARLGYQQALEWATAVRYRPEVAITRFQLAELLLDGPPEEQQEAQAHLEFATDEFRAMKMQPYLERALSHRGLLHA